jgi:predicted restriction endonuclease
LAVSSSIGRDIPEQLRREVLVEADHKCAIPTCRQAIVEIAHITPWEEVYNHTFDNLIALCPIDHDRYDTKPEIDRKARQRYKANLSIGDHQARHAEIENHNKQTERGSYIILDQFAFDPVGYEVRHKVF